VTALAFNRVSVTLGGKSVVDNVSFAVADREWVALIGPNGAGKTTLLRALCGLVAYEGAVRVFGRDARVFSRRELAQTLALVPQVPLMPADLTVAQYVLLGRTPHLSYFAHEGRADREAVAIALKRLDLETLTQRRLGSLSGGERQRVTLARALAQAAPVMLLDEPTTALDVGRQQQVLEIVDELRSDHALTVLSTMHDLTLAGQYADRLVLLDAGRVAAEGDAGDVLTGPLIAEHYRADVRVVGDDSGLVVVPVRRRA
jgi:iron complex transport system ATP-binding protein